MADSKTGWRVVRQDDNGNRFVVAEDLTEEAARRSASELTARGHKQTYWVEPPREEAVQGKAG